MSAPDGKSGGAARQGLDGTAASGPIHLLIADDHQFVIESFAAYLTARNPAIRVSAATSIPQALALAAAHSDLDLALLDMNMPEMNGLQGLRHLKQQRPALPVAILSGDVSANVVQAVRDAGASGFIAKAMSASAVWEAINLILAGGPYFPAELIDLAPLRRTSNLSPREHEVLAGLIRGRSNKEIALALNVSAATVALHLTSIYRKLDVTSRSQAIRRAFELGLHQERRRGS